jgi:hypothetical protein
MEEKKINFKALGRAIIVLKPELKQETESGIFKGDEILKEEKKFLDQQFLEVLEVGDDVKKIKPGDRILCSGMLTTIIIDGVECGFTYEPSIVGIKL